MTDALAQRPRPVPRSLLRVVGAGACALMLLGGVVFALYLSRPQSGLGHEIVDMIESPIGDNDAIRYNAHTVLGKLFSICPCTGGLSADQYRRAFYHRPRPTAAP